MKPLVWTFLMGAAAALGQPAIALPQMGWIASDGQLRPVMGLAANFVLGDSIADSVVSSSFSGWFGFVKTGSSILVLDRAGQVLYQTGADPGPALFAFSSDGSPALVYITESKSLLSWKTDHLEATQCDFDGAVMAIGVTGVIVKRDNGLWAIDRDAGTETFLAAAGGPIFLRSDGSLLYSDSQSFVLQAPDGTQRRIDGLVSASSLEQMEKDWVHITEQDSSRHFAIRLEPGREQLFELPDGVQ